MKKVLVFWVVCFAIGTTIGMGGCKRKDVYEREQAAAQASAKSEEEAVWEVQIGTGAILQGHKLESPSTGVVKFVDNSGQVHYVSGDWHIHTQGK